MSLNSQSPQPPTYTPLCLLLPLPAPGASFKAPGIVTSSLRLSLTPSDPAIAFVPSHHPSSAGSLTVCLWALSLCSFLGGMGVIPASTSQDGCESEVSCSVDRACGTLSVLGKHHCHFYYFHRHHTNKALSHSVSSCACVSPASLGFLRAGAVPY